MALPVILGVAGAGLGALQYGQKKKEAAKQRELQAEIARWSPWSGMQANTQGTQDPNLVGEVLTGATGLGGFGQSLGQYGQAQDLSQAQIQSLKSQSDLNQAQMNSKYPMYGPAPKG